jgi:hypothetical protein
MPEKPVAMICANEGLLFGVLFRLGCVAVGHVVLVKFGPQDLDIDRSHHRTVWEWLLFGSVLYQDIHEGLPQ